MKTRIHFGLLGLFFAQITFSTEPAQAGWIERRVVFNDGRVITQSVQPVKERVSQAKLLMTRLPAFLFEGGDGIDWMGPQPVIEEIYHAGTSIESLPKGLARFVEQRNLIRRNRMGEIPGSEVRTLVAQGPLQNRINLTIIGDGYTAEEKQKFFDDAARLTKDMFVGKTFATYLALFNVHAVFIPSKESGITDIVKKDTALGLYRSPKGSKRAIMISNAGMADKAANLAPRTDYPILIANDDFYGGLGGAYAISTRSVTSGTVVLRHELGHNFGSVGEEYDSGNVYTGANSSRSTQVNWKQWLDPGATQKDHYFLSGFYLWQNLGQKPFRAEFEIPTTSRGQEVMRVGIELSSVGWATPMDVIVRVDGYKIDIKGNYTVDRSFFDVVLPMTLGPGKHSIEVIENINDRDNVLAYANVYAFPKGYDAESGQISAYKTFYGPGNGSGYRPTHNTCLMRNMLSENFCMVDIENMWIRFLARVNLIDGVAISRAGDVRVDLLKLRGMDIIWEKKQEGNWVRIPEFDHKTQVNISDLNSVKYRVRAAFRTPEVRKLTPDFDETREIN